MLNHRNIIVLFCFILAIVGSIDLWYFNVSIWFYIFLFIFYSLLVFWGCITIGSGFFIPVICAANTKERVIALTFDDGPSPEHTPKILSILKDYNVEAAFFCIGNRLKGNENIVLQTINEGHIIGNHSNSHHFFFDLYSSSKMLMDMQEMDTELKLITGLKPLLFRPPYGVTNPNLKRAIIKGNYIPIGWNVRSMDTVANDKDKLFKKITECMKPGAIYLFHDTISVTVDILPDFLKYVKDKGYEIVRLDKLLNLNAYA